jgi:hypothetical protein
MEYYFKVWQLLVKGSVFLFQEQFKLFCFVPGTISKIGNCSVLGTVLNFLFHEKVLEQNCSVPKLF